MGSSAETVGRFRVYRVHRVGLRSGCCLTRRTGRQGQVCLGHADRRQVLRLRRTAARLWGLTATRMVESAALVPSMTRSVRRHGGAWSVVAADFAGVQKAKQFAAGDIERALLGVGLAM